MTILRKSKIKNNPCFISPCFINPCFINPCFITHVLLIHVFSLHLLLIHVLLIHVLLLHVLLIHVLLIHVLSLHLLLIQSMFYQSSPVHILSHAQSDNMTTDLYHSGPLRDPFFPLTTINSNNALDRSPPTMSEVCDTPITNNHGGTNSPTQ